MGDLGHSGFSLRRLGLTVYLPATVYSIGHASILPVIAVSAVELGASLSVGGLMVGLIGLGQVAGALPSGALITRFGERTAMLLATAVLLPALLVAVFATAVWALGAAVFAIGLAAALWGVARQAYMAEAVPIAMRARALSTLGGVSRIGAFIGPFVSAAVMIFLGTAGAYWVYVACGVLAGALLMALPPVSHDRRAATPPTRLRDVIVAHRRTLGTVGAGALMISVMRASRQTVIPLWGTHLGLSPTTLAIIFGISGAVDMLLFYPGGAIMDRFGRRAVALPSMSTLAAAHALLPLSSGPWSLALVAMLMGLGNGLSAGIVMTLGADASPTAGRAQFLGAWRLVADLGNGAGPLLISAIIATVSLPAAVLTMAAVGAAAVATLWRFVPRHIPPGPG
ncbi:MFS transporter [Catenuloplanes atrovinosus]|uniref:MFS family permease n=1 Tax=Catenuloplanes atrovinosus TaxID=137266 RepID=A0AAE3YJK6_9ACTN|nr:MFS transporter [Catenuloplanes atrovinosus]MDR7274685.1 MFS family permease [Catenuloplanes atrovinosus]